ncbi:MAG: glycosyltransferase family 4 protein [Oscillospiraceae bacterium]|jgi:glycosyltransferase involved in cell wall biosynthesis
MKKKLCIIIQRYGKEIVGGAETYCRTYAERLTEFYDVEVVTTCALDYMEWKNHFNEGLSKINGVNVRRFSVDKPRDLELFSKLCNRLYGDSNHTAEQAVEWVNAQGPVSKKMISYLQNSYDDFDVFIFMTYLYYHTLKGLPCVKDKAILIPFAHDEPPAYLKCYDELFKLPRGIVFNTDEERKFIQLRFKNKEIPSITTGIGIDIPTENKFFGKDKAFRLRFPYILYMGRIENSKGCDELLDWFLKYKRRYKNNLHLVLIGKEEILLPKSKDIVSLGFVSEEKKFAVLKKSMCLVLPSHFESLSIVVLEAFAVGKPVLVSGHSAVLKGHCEKSDGGLYFFNEPDFCESLEFLRLNPELRSAMGKNGEKYVDKYYQWGIIMKKLVDFIDSL